MSYEGTAARGTSIRHPTAAPAEVLAERWYGFYPRGRSHPTAVDAGGFDAVVMRR